MTRYLLGSLFLTLALSLSARGDDAKDDSKAIDGTWLPLTAELAGEKFPDEVRKAMKLIIGDGKYTLTISKVPDKGTLKMDPAQKPKTIDVVGIEGANKGKTILAIYELKDDSLKICYDLTGKARPTEFKTEKGTKLFLVTYQREKP